MRSQGLSPSGHRNINNFSKPTRSQFIIILLDGVTKREKVPGTGTSMASIILRRSINQSQVICSHTYTNILLINEYNSTDVAYLVQSSYKVMYLLHGWADSVGPDGCRAVAGACQGFDATSCGTFPPHPAQSVHIIYLTRSKGVHGPDGNP